MRLLFVMLILKNSFLFQYNWTRDNSRKIVKNISGERIIIILETDVDYISVSHIMFTLFTKAYQMFRWKDWRDKVAGELRQSVSLESLTVDIQAGLDCYPFSLTI